MLGNLTLFAQEMPEFGQEMPDAAVGGALAPASPVVCLAPSRTSAAGALVGFWNSRGEGSVRPCTPSVGRFASFWEVAGRQAVLPYIAWGGCGIQALTRWHLLR